MISNEKLKDYTYYLKRMSMFLNESYGIKERIAILHSLLVSIDNYYEEIVDRINVLNTDVNSYYKSEKFNKDEDVNKLLDYVGGIFCCTRNLRLLVNKSQGQIIAKPETLSPTAEYDNITLNNSDFLTYIKCQIIKQNFIGTREELLYLYRPLDYKNSSNKLIDLQFIYIFDNDATANVTVYWNNANQSITDTSDTNLRYLFLNGYLTIESMGIQYDKSILNVDNIAIFDSSYWSDLDEEPPIISYWG